MYINSSIVKSIFKGFPHRPGTICSLKYIKKETQFSIDIFVENEHKRTFLENLVKNYNVKKKSNDSRSYTNSKNHWSKNQDRILKREQNITFISCKNLQSILCQSKAKLLPNSHPAVYQLDCSSNGKYIGESKKNLLTRCIGHQQDIIKGSWESSGATEHIKVCEGQFNWIHPRTIAIMSNMYKKKSLK